MLDRALRSEMPHDSALHWDAQAKITGPWRDGNLLVFSCTSPLENVESWWLFYELASGLDSEIRSVYDYLRNRTASAGRFSLQGVKGVESPTSFNNYVRLAQNITPIDIRVQPDSMERVVQLLGGQQLYGADRLAPVRELIQNARDAIELRNAMESADGYPPTAGQITVSLEGVGSSRVLVVRDNGVGMSKKVILKHLIGVASDFWNSVEFYQSFRRALETGFRPIGKFGIGFLSVFMLGEEVHVETESIGSSWRFDLKLHGVGRRGELKERTATGQIGTEVRIVLKKGASDMMQDLAAVVRARAPMLRVPISVSTSIDANHKNESIAPRWWMRSTQDEILQFLSSWHDQALYGGSAQARDIDRGQGLHGMWSRGGYRESDHFSGQWSVKGWPGTKPDHIDERGRLLSSGGNPSAGVVRCSQGIAIDLVHVSDVSGLVELGEVELTVTRESTANTRAALAERIAADIQPEVLAATNALGDYGMLPGRVRFIRGLAQTYGPEVLEKTTLQWIPLTIPPGDLVHQSREQVARHLAGQDQLLVAVGASPEASTATQDTSFRYQSSARWSYLRQVSRKPRPTISGEISLTTMDTTGYCKESWITSSKRAASMRRSWFCCPFFSNV